MSDEIRDDPALSAALMRLKELDSQEESRLRARADFNEKFNELVSSILETLPDALIVVDDQGEIFMVNSQTEFLFGYHRSELIGKKVEMLVPDRFKSHHAEHRASYSMQPHVRTMGVGMQLWGRRKNGTEVPVEIMLAPLMTTNGLYNLALIRRSKLPGKKWDIYPQVKLADGSAGGSDEPAA